LPFSDLFLLSESANNQPVPSNVDHKPMVNNPTMEPDQTTPLLTVKDKEMDPETDLETPPEVVMKDQEREVQPLPRSSKDVTTPLVSLTVNFPLLRPKPVPPLISPNRLLPNGHLVRMVLPQSHSPKLTLKACLKVNKSKDKRDPETMKRDNKDLEMMKRDVKDPEMMKRDNRDPVTMKRDNKDPEMMKVKKNHPEEVEEKEEEEEALLRSLPPTSDIDEMILGDLSQICKLSVEL
jgi:hypothetical protein